MVFNRQQHGFHQAIMRFLLDINMILCQLKLLLQLGKSTTLVIFSVRHNTVFILYVTQQVTNLIRQQHHQSTFLHAPKATKCESSVYFFFIIPHVFMHDISYEIVRANSVWYLLSVGAQLFLFVFSFCFLFNYLNSCLLFQLDTSTSFQPSDLYRAPCTCRLGYFLFHTIWW